MSVTAAMLLEECFCGTVCNPFLNCWSELLLVVVEISINQLSGTIGQKTCPLWGDRMCASISTIRKKSFFKHLN